MNASDPGDPGFIPNVAIRYGNIVDETITQDIPNGTLAEDEVLYEKGWSRIPFNCGYPLSCAVGSARVVHNYTMNNGQNAPRVFSLRYRNGSFDRRGHGFLGFGARIVRDEATQATTAEIYDNYSFDTTYNTYWALGRMTNMWSWAPGLASQPEPSQIELTYADIANSISDGSAPGTFFSYEALRTTRRFEGTYPSGALTLLEYAGQEEGNWQDLLTERYRSIDTVNAYGDIENETDETFGADTTTIARTFNDDPSAWLIGILTDEHTCSTADAGPTQCRDVTHVPDAYGDEVSGSSGDATDPETQLSTGNTRDVFGNVIASWADDMYSHHRSACVTFDADGTFPIAERNGLSQTIYRAFDPGRGVVFAEMDPNGLQTMSTIDMLGRATKIVGPEGATNITRTRSQTGGPNKNWWKVETTVAVDGHGQSTTEVDMLGRTVRTSTPGPAVTACDPVNCSSAPVFDRLTQYDYLGHLTARSGSFLDGDLPSTAPWESYAYDAVGRVVSRTTPWQSVIQYAYAGLSSQVTDSAGTATVQTDTMGRVLNVTDKKGTLTTYEYGAFGTTPQVTQDMVLSSTTYDAYGRPRTQGDPDRGPTTINYDGFDEVTSTTDALGRTLSFDYDVLGRVLHRHDTDGVTTFAYDPTNGIGQHPAAATVGVQVRYEVGSRDEPGGLGGLAHFVEHMMFDGSKHVPAGQLSRVLATAGATDVNGHTWFDQTSYIETMPPERLETALWLESDRMGYFDEALDAATVERERAVVLNEYSTVVLDAPLGAMDGFVRAALFPSWHPYHRMPSGTAATIAAIKLDDIRAFHATWYGPGNAVLSLAGKLDPIRAMALVERYFGPLPTRDPPRRPAVPAFVPTGETRLSVGSAGAFEDVVEIGWVTPPIDTPDDLALDIVASLLTGAKSARLTARLGDENGVRATQHSLELASVFTIRVTVQDRTPTDVLEQVTDEIDRFIASGPTAAELARVRGTWMTSDTADFDTPSQRANVLADKAARGVLKLPFELPFDRHRVPSAADVRGAAARWLGAPDRVVAVGSYVWGKPMSGEILTVRRR